jgi:hypothetical protein
MPRKTSGEWTAEELRPQLTAHAWQELVTDVPLFFNSQMMHKPRIFSDLCEFLGAFSLWLL